MDKRIRLLEQRRAFVKQAAFAGKESVVAYSGSAKCGDKRILHIVPHIYFMQGYEYLGSSKDIDGRQQYLWQCGAPFDTFSHMKDQFTLADELSYFTLPEYSHIILDLSRSSGDLAYLRRRWPRARLIVRSHNPELTHRLDYLRAAKRVGSTFTESKSAIANVGVFLRRERGVARYADTVLHIETRNTIQYWRSLGFGGDIHVTPYFVSDYYSGAIPSGGRREKQVICVGSTHPGILIAEMMLNFHASVEALYGRLPEFVFTTTGDVPPTAGRNSLSPRVRHLGVVGNLPALLTKIFAIAVTSDLGRGFKTKILEAIMCGAWVIVTPGLMRRMPNVLKPYCAAIDLRNAGESLAKSIEELSARKWPGGDPNATLRSQAFDTLDAAIFGDQKCERNQVIDRSYTNDTCKRLNPGSAP